MEEVRIEMDPGTMIRRVERLSCDSDLADEARRLICEELGLDAARTTILVACEKAVDLVAGLTLRLNDSHQLLEGIRDGELSDELLRGFAERYEGSKATGAGAARERFDMAKLLVAGKVVRGLWAAIEAKGREVQRAEERAEKAEGESAEALEVLGRLDFYSAGKASGTAEKARQYADLTREAEASGRKVMAAVYGALEKANGWLVALDEQNKASKRTRDEVWGRAEKAEAEARHLGQKLVAADAVIQRPKGHLALLNHTPDGKPYPLVTPLPMPDLPRTWEKTGNGFAARCDHQDDDAENGSPRGQMALERVGDRVRLVFTYDMADVPDGGDWTKEYVERMARRVALVGQRNSPEGCVFRSLSGEPGVRFSPLVARLLAARVLQLRATLPPERQEALIAEQLGLMNAEESMADALARWKAAMPAPSAAT